MRLNIIRATFKSYNKINNFNDAIVKTMKERVVFLFCLFDDDPICGEFRISVEHFQENYAEPN